MVCPECGTERLPNARFCHSCGWDSKLAAAGRSASTAGQRPAWKRWVSGFSLGVMTLLLSILLLVPRSDADAAIQVGQPAPDFELESLEAQRVRLSALQGKPVVVNFWATWCPPCRKEMPHFEQVYDEYREMGLEFYAINVGESQVAVSDFMERLGVDLPVLIDAEETAQTDYKILPLPATFFIDREGIVRGVYQFQMSQQQIEAEVQRLLAR